MLVSGHSLPPPPPSTPPLPRPSGLHRQRVCVCAYVRVCVSDCLCLARQLDPSHTRILVAISYLLVALASCYEKRATRKCAIAWPTFHFLPLGYAPAFTCIVVVPCD